MGKDAVEVLKENVLLLASKIDEVTNKLNEVIAVLQENNLTRKIEVDYIHPEETEESQEEGEDSEDEEEELEDDDEEIIDDKPSKH